MKTVTQTDIWRDLTTPANATETQCISFREVYWVRWWQFLVDVVALQISLVLSYLFFLQLQVLPNNPVMKDFRDLSFGLLVIPCGYWFLKMYPGYGQTESERLRRKVRITFVFFMAFTMWNFLIDEGKWSRGVLLFALLLALIIPPVCQTLLRKLLIVVGKWGTPVLVIGGGKAGSLVVARLNANPGLGYRPIAMLDSNDSTWGTKVANVPVVGGYDLALRFVNTVNYVVLAATGSERDRMVEFSNSLPFLNIVMVPDLYGMQSLWVQSRDLGGILGLEMQKSLLLRRNLLLKRLIDYVIGIPFFLLSVPIIALFGLWILAVSPGNPFYCQVREGFHGRRIKVWKLRTMYPGAEGILKQHLDANSEARKEWHCYFKLKKDPRIIKYIGTFLRKTSLDELPQLWNILSGEMSLVGPRPFPHYHLEQFPAEFRVLRRSVLPGLTGLWQVTSRSDGDLKVQEYQDTYYIRNWSPWMDLTLLGRTVWIVLRGKGAY